MPSPILPPVVNGPTTIKGSLDCSTNPNYSSAAAGDAYYVSVAGKVGGASGVSVYVGDLIVALDANVGGTQAAVGSHWFVLEHSLPNWGEITGTPTTVAGYGITDAITSANTGNTLWVDAVNGSNITGTRGRLDKPFLTISGALAASGLASGDVIRVSPGTFTENSGIVLPSGVSLVCSGQGNTVIQSTLDFVASGHAIVALGTNSFVGFLTINGTAGSGVFQAPIGQAVSNSDFTGAVIQNVTTNADTDGLYIRATTSSTLKAFNCIFISKYDGVNILDNGYAELYNCVSEVTGPSTTGAGFARGVAATAAFSSTATGGLARWYGGKISVNGGTTRNAGVEATSNYGTTFPVVEVYGAEIILGTSATTNKTLFTSGIGAGPAACTIKYSGVSMSDGSAITTGGAGTFTELSRYAVRDNNLSDLASASTARTNLGLAIGINVQAWDTDLDTWATITPGTGVGTALGTNVGSAGAFVTNGGALGTPSSGTLTNATGLPITGITSTTSAQLRTLLSDENGTGAALFSGATSPAFVTPDLGTPSALVLTNASGTASININGTVGATTPTTGAFTTLTNTGAATNSVAGAASTPAQIFTGAWLTGGTGTTNFPHLFLQATGTTASTVWSTAGTALGINAVTGFTGNFIDAKLAGASNTGFKVTSAGTATFAGDVVVGGGGNFRLQGPSNGIGVITNNAGTAWTRLCFITNTSSAPAVGVDAVNGFTLQSGAGTATWNDASTANSGTVANRYLFGIAAPTLTATGTSVTNTVASTFYIGGAPTDSTNTTSTTKYALNVAAGNTTLGGTLAVTGASTLTGAVTQTAKTTTYNNIATVSNGVPSEVATIDSTGLTANVAASTLYAVPASGAGLYRVSAYLVTTTAASVSSTMPNAQVVYTDSDSNTSVTLDVSPILGAAGLGQSGLLTANAVGTVFSGTVVVYIKASTTIQYQTVNYASTAGGMAYALRMKLEAL